MPKKYFVFISSTLDDLKTERRELIKVVTELGAVPITMDGFNISESGGELIKKAIEESDYFVNLTAYKCGPSVGRSFATEIEFTWAEKYSIPVISFIIDEKARWKAAKKETQSGAIKDLENFKKRLKEHSSDTWISTADLSQKATALLVRKMNLNPREGWIRGHDAIDPSVTNELGRLLRENESLKRHIRMESGGSAGRLDEQINENLKVLAMNKISLSFWYTTSDNWENTGKFRYLRLFKLLAPELNTAKTTSDISRFLGNILNPDLGKIVRKDYPTPTNTIKKIMADFSLLKLVRSGDTKNGDDEAWEITEYGMELFAAYRLRQMDRALRKIQNITDEPAAAEG
jgi:hypothetical protein